eukprot:TRINITY_DN2364_c2_g1_i1.p1 TRINITY_DN2364_c2_g1~~TRINITY_DN2364_c2_g1_i1.p1  ORF type:complete len:997 (+),score=223.79 TRINITY_DN2364_c2_g1_i1:49-2991(+)
MKTAMNTLRARNRLISLFQARLKSSSPFEQMDTLGRRHIGINDDELKEMLKDVKAETLEQFMSEVVPKSISEPEGLPVDEKTFGEKEWLAHFKEMMGKNKLMKQCIGMGFYETKTPNVILRNVIESPGWYTPYTPYQAEVSQGRLESLMNYQQIVTDMTGLPLANASLLDEATACGEAVGMSQAHSKGKKRTVFIDENLHPASIECAKTRGEGFGMTVIIGKVDDCDFTNTDLGLIIVQYPDTYGNVNDYSKLFATAKENKVLSCCSADILSLALLTPPGELGADIACGTTQRLGVPLGFGGPHAAYFATRTEYARVTPGRIIGVSKDNNEKTVFRMALQTREQHIKREKATSNICTAQALLANVAAMYGVWHGPKGIKDIAKQIHTKTKVLALGLEQAGMKVLTESYFDTIRIDTTAVCSSQEYVKKCVEGGVNIRLIDSSTVGISIDECTDEVHIRALLSAAGLSDVDDSIIEAASSKNVIPESLTRTTEFLTHPTFNRYHSETELMRYIYKLQKKDLALNTAMIPLGSCTMKLNAAVEMLPITWPEINSIHPYAPVDQVDGYSQMLRHLEEQLSIITGMDATCIQPNSGSQGEYAGLRIIKAYHESKGDFDRDICVIPSSAHGTNPASATMCGLKIAVVKCLPSGAVDLEDLKHVLTEKYPGKVAAFMITYPSTFGVFDEGIKEINEMVHAAGAQVYVDGANMNAQMGHAFPGHYGGDVLHLNLHKTFAIPHGGGGPGMGPICMKKHLTPFLPGTASPGITCGGETPFGQVSQAPYGSASVLPISYTYINLLGYTGLKKCSAVAVLNANYMMTKLSEAYPILYTGPGGRCGHEFIIDLRPFKKLAGVEVEDIAKRLMDYNFHAPTMSFPVAGTLMIEPTESESKYELDRFVNAMLSIREEIRDIETGKADSTDNLLKNAPHTIESLLEWEHPYTKKQAVFPAPDLYSNKSWPSCGRINSAFGDRNFMCSCPPIETYV